MRPRKAGVAPAGSKAPDGAASLRQWERRVFKNTYTYKGRSKKVKGWSVKLQFKGKRHTLSLKSSLRSDAAQEAARLHERLVANGWASIRDGFEAHSFSHRRGVENGATESVRARSDVRYWKERLLQRRYPAPTKDFSVCIEHEGRRQFFPLGTPDPDGAVAVAAAIYRTVTTEGWQSALECFPRELTVGFHWQANPVLCTYTTFHSGPNEAATPPLKTSGAFVSVVVVEKDGGVRKGLESCIKANAGARCQGGYRTPREAFQQTWPKSGELWLVNRLLFRASEFAGLKRSCSDLCIITYSVYEDSDHLFLAAPGGTLGYFLKRTPPERMLEPVLAGGSDAPFCPEEASRRVTRYFEAVLNLGRGGKPVRSIEQLTRREQEVLELLSRGCLDKEIAAELGISSWTVHGHVKNIFEKLQVHTRTEAVVHYLQK